MTWETIAISGFQALQAHNTMKEGRASARALVAEAQIQAENKAADTVRAAGKLQTNFLNSGITLEDGPQDIIARAYASGRRDVSRIVENANIRSKNTIKSSRTKMLEGIASAVGGIDFKSTFDDLGFGDNITKAPMSMGPFWGVNENLSMTIGNPSNSEIF